MLHLEHANTKETYTMIKQNLNHCARLLKDSETEFCTITKERYLQGLVDRAKASVAKFENENPEVLI